MGSIIGSSGRAFLTDPVDEVVISETDASSSIEIGVVSAGRSDRFALIDVYVENIALIAGLRRNVGTGSSVP